MDFIEVMGTDGRPLLVQRAEVQSVRCDRDKNCVVLELIGGRYLKVTDDYTTLRSRLGVAARGQA